MKIKYRNTPSHPCDYVTEAATRTTLLNTYNISNMTKVILIYLALSEYVDRIMRPINLTNGDGYGPITLVGVGKAPVILGSDEYNCRSLARTGIQDDSHGIVFEDIRLVEKSNIVLVHNQVFTNGLRFILERENIMQGLIQGNTLKMKV